MDKPEPALEPPLLMALLTGLMGTVAALPAALLWVSLLMLGRGQDLGYPPPLSGPLLAVNALFVLILVVGPPVAAYAMYHGFCRPRTGILLALAVVAGAWVTLLLA